MMISPHKQLRRAERDWFVAATCFMVTLLTYDLSQNAWQLHTFRQPYYYIIFGLLALMSLTHLLAQRAGSRYQQLAQFFYISGVLIVFLLTLIQPALP